MWPFKPDISKLKSMGDAAKLGKACRYPDHKVRAKALRALGAIGGDTAVESVVAGLADKDSTVRGAALGSLQVLIENEKQPGIVSSVVRGLDRLGHARAAEPLRGLLAFTAYNHPQITDAAVRALKRLVVPLDDVTRGACAAAERDWSLAAKLGSAAVEPLLAVLVKPQTAEADLVAAVDVLGQIGDPRAAVPMIELLRHDSPEIAAAAARNIRKLCVPKVATTEIWCLMASENWPGVVSLGPAAVQPLCAVLGKHRWNRLKAVETLGRIGGPEAAKQLAELLSSPSLELARAAAESLGRLGPPAADALRHLTNKTLKKTREFDVSELLVKVQVPLSLLCDLLKKESGSRAQGIAAAALLLAGETAVPELCRTLESPCRTARLSAAGLLGDLGDSRAVAPLVGLLEGSDVGPCRAALSALRQLGWDPSSIGEPVLESLCRHLKSDSGHDRSSAAALLGELGDQRAIKQLTPLLADRYADVALAALEALRLLHWDSAGTPERILRELCGRLGTPSGDVRTAALGMLGQIGNSRALEFFPPLLTDEDLKFSRAAAETMEKLGHRPATPEAQACLAIVQGRWEIVVAQGAPAVLPLASALLRWKEVKEPALAALAKLGMGPGDDMTGSLAAASGFLYSQGGADAIFDLLLEGIRKPGENRYLCSQALANLYHAGQLSDEHKRRILANRGSVVASKHLDVRDGPHTDQEHRYHVDYPASGGRPRQDYMARASDCSHTDESAHRDSRTDEELL